MLSFVIKAIHANVHGRWWNMGMFGHTFDPEKAIIINHKRKLSITMMICA